MTNTTQKIIASGNKRSIGIQTKGKRYEREKKYTTNTTTKTTKINKNRTSGNLKENLIIDNRNEAKEKKIREKTYKNKTNQKTKYSNIEEKTFKFDN